MRCLVLVLIRLHLTLLRRPRPQFFLERSRFDARSSIDKGSKLRAAPQPQKQKRHMREHKQPKAGITS
jgi:hypothetical protein